MPPSTILTIEDDTAIRRGIVDALRFSGYQVFQSGDGDDGLLKSSQLTYDLLLLDLALPGTPGLEILKTVRKTKPSQPVIILSAKGDETDRVAGLKLGADDYVVKPFSMKELLARVEAVLRRTPSRPINVAKIRFSHGVIDFERREIRFIDNQRTELSAKESAIVKYLADHRGRSISRDELLSNVWGLSPQGIATRTIDMHIARLREKLRDGEKPTTLLTVRGKGYMWASATQDASS